MDSITSSPKTWALVHLPTLLISSRLTIWLLFCVLAFLLLKAVKAVCNFIHVCRLMAKIPGPPSHPLLGHGILVLYLDRFKFIHGTYVCECRFLIEVIFKTD